MKNTIHARPGLNLDNCGGLGGCEP
jgi:hypothetical protein